MRIHILSSLLCLGLLGLPISAHAAAAACDPANNGSTSCILSPCTNLGQTTMDATKENIIACLGTVPSIASCTTATCVWKSMTGANPTLTESSGATLCSNGGSSGGCSRSYTTKTAHGFCVLTAVETDQGAIGGNNIGNNCVERLNANGTWTLISSVDSGSGGETNCAMDCFDFQ